MQKILSLLLGGFVLAISCTSCACTDERKKPNLDFIGGSLESYLDAKGTFEANQKMTIVLNMDEPRSDSSRHLIRRLYLETDELGNVATAHEIAKTIGDDGIESEATTPLRIQLLDKGSDNYQIKLISDAGSIREYHLRLYVDAERQNQVDITLSEMGEKRHFSSCSF